MSKSSALTRRLKWRDTVKFSKKSEEHHIARRNLLKIMAAGIVGLAATPFLLSAGSGHAATPAGGLKMLTVFYSRSGNTRALARTIQSIAGGDSVELETVQPYPTEYRATTDQAKKELAAGYYPPLKVTVDDISSYDLIVVGSPSWWGTFASPVRGFLAHHDFTGKKLAPFITHEGSGLGKSIDDMRTLCPGALVMEGLAVRGGSVADAENQTRTWLRRIGAAE